MLNLCYSRLDIPTVVRRRRAMEAMRLLADFLTRVASGDIYWR